MALGWVEQDDFAAGTIRAVARHLIPPQGFYTGLNGLLDDDGSFYGRHGSQYKSASAFGTGGLRFLWDGVLAGGQRTLFATSAKFGVLDVDDTTVVDLGGGGLSLPGQSAVIDGMLFLPGGTIYAGSRKTADYSTGTVSVTNGSKSVTGAGTLWSANADAGMLLRLAGRYYPVASIGSDTTLTLKSPYQGTTAAGAAYVLSRFGAAATGGAPTSQLYASVANRLIAAGGRIIQFSNGVDPTTGALRPFTFDIDDFHELPAGADLITVAPIRDRLAVFSTRGLWLLSGLPFSIIDFDGNPNHKLELMTGEMIALGAAGVATWENALVVPGLDAVYMVDGINPPEPITRGLGPLYEDHVRAGRTPGKAVVFRHHYFLPILDSGAVVRDLLVIRLDRAVQSRLGVVFPDTQWDGHAGNVTALAQRATTSGAPELLAAGADGRVLKLTEAAKPGSSTATADADATNWVVKLETRDFETGVNRASNTVRRLKVRYELEGAAVLSAFISVGRAEGGQPKWGTAVWGSFAWADSSLGEFAQLAGAGLASDGREPYVFEDPVRQGRYVRFRLMSLGAYSKLIIRSVAFAARASRRR